MVAATLRRGIRHHGTGLALDAGQTFLHVTCESPCQEVSPMPSTRTIQKEKAAKQQGKASSTQAGEFVREEIHHVREGKHGARSTKQAIAIGLSKARRAGVALPPPTGGSRQLPPHA